MTRYELLLLYISSNTNSSNNIPGTYPSYGSKYRSSTRTVKSNADILDALGLKSLTVQQAEGLLQQEVLSRLTNDFFSSGRFLVCDTDNAIVHEGLLQGTDLHLPQFRDTYNWYAYLPQLFSQNNFSWVRINSSDLEVLDYVAAS